MMFGSSYGVSISIPVLGVLKVSADGKMIDVDTSFIGAADMPNDFPRGNSSAMPNPDQTIRSPDFGPDLQKGAPRTGESPLPFDAAIGHRIAKVRYAVEQCGTAGPVVSWASEFAFGKEVGVSGHV